MGQQLGNLRYFKSNSFADLVLPPVLSQRGLGIPTHYFIDFNDIVLNDKIHESELSVIYEGEYNGHEVAVKIFNPVFVDLQSFKEEFQLVRYTRERSSRARH
jgi:hypothetical protein